MQGFIHFGLEMGFRCYMEPYVYIVWYITLESNDIVCVMHWRITKNWCIMTKLAHDENT